MRCGNPKRLRSRSRTWRRSSADATTNAHRRAVFRRAPQRRPRARRAAAFNDGETRAQFDDVDDYDGLDRATAARRKRKPACRLRQLSRRCVGGIRNAGAGSAAGSRRADRCKARNRNRFDAGKRSDVVQRVAGQFLMARRYAQRAARVGGFTLIELVVVITVMGILSIGVVSFITDASDGYANTVRRTELGSTLRLAAERVTRELRNALPNSARVSGNCLEFIPVEGGSTYLNLPVAITSTTFNAAAPIDAAMTGTRIAVFPDSAADCLFVGRSGSDFARGNLRSTGCEQRGACNPGGVASLSGRVARAALLHGARTGVVLRGWKSAVALPELRLRSDTTDCLRHCQRACPGAV